MSSGLSISGEWPSAVTLTRGWSLARARPWNDDTPDVLLRLERGGSEFLRDCTTLMESLSGSDVYSPAVYSTSTRVWKSSGYEESVRLEIMERSLAGAGRRWENDGIEATGSPDWDTMTELDQVSFEGFWRLGRLGLEEALGATRRGAALLAKEGGEYVGYAIVGAQWSSAYLQRIAVHPDARGRGFGGRLLKAAMAWGRRNSAITILLNVRPGDSTAREFYERHGFVPGGAALRVLRHRSSRDAC